MKISVVAGPFAMIKPHKIEGQAWPDLCTNPVFSIYLRAKPGLHPKTISLQKTGFS
jgi:hypothetical protein